MEIAKAEQVRKRIEESNALFLGSSREGKRVILAMDIIYQLALHRMVPMSVYFNPGPELFSPENDEKEVKEVLGGVEQCYVCGIGAVFMAAVERLNEFKFTDFDGDIPTSGPFRSSLIRYIAGHDLFTRLELETVEAFFEWDYAARHNGESAKKWLDVDEGFGRDVRLKRIAEVIIKTEGRERLDLDLIMAELPTGEFDPMLVTP